MRIRIAVAALIVLGLAAWGGIVLTGHLEKHPPAYANEVIPAPVSEVATGTEFTLTAATTISSDVPDIATYLAGALRPSTGFPLPIRARGTIALSLHGAPAAVGPQGYRLTVTGTGVRIQAEQPAGLFAGVQTLLQLLPAAVAAPTVRRGPWRVQGGTIVDHPRFAYRGAMLDVARHFFTVAQVERYVDEIAHYKINYLHLHLSDDQGWRIAIRDWPALTGIGGGTEVGGPAGGYYTQADYSAIVAYAAARYITVIPEIDMPGHTNAALASYARLNCTGTAPRSYTGTNTGFSSLCVPLDLTYTFVGQVIGQLAALTPGPYIHIGGDESSATPPAEYRDFVDRVQQIVRAHGKTVIGWHDIATASLLPTTVAEFWGTTASNARLAAAVAHGTRVIMAPATHAYLDQKYTDATTLGLTWAGVDDVNQSYDWDPGTYLAGVGESSVLGVEAALWSETLTSSADIDYMAFPRLAGIAEVGWSPWSTHSVAAFDVRLAAQGPRWTAAGIRFYRSTQVKWPG